MGGLIGVGFADISDCETRGTIKVNQSHSDVLIGGLVGCFIVNSEENYTISNSNTNISITMGNLTFNEDGSIAIKEGTYAKTGGLIGSVEVIGQLTIKNCGVNGDITGGGHAGGFISYATGYGASKIRINNCYVKNNIKNAVGAGFIYWIINRPDSGGIFEITNCFSEGKIHANMTAGFCYMVGKDVRIYSCYTERNIQSMAGTAGFVQQIEGGIIEECFSTGVVTVKYQGSAFIFFATNAVYIKNCYSTSDVSITNTDPNSTFRTLGSGIILISSNVVMIENCYYSGKISGNVHTTSQVSGLGSIVGGFAGTIDNSLIANCYLLTYEDTFATDYIVQNVNPISPTDLTVYNNIADMGSLADKLNEGLDKPVWVMGANGLPQLKFAVS